MIISADALDYTHERLQEFAREEGIEQGREEGLREGLKNGVKSIITNALRKGNKPEEVADFNDIPLEEVLSIQDEMRNE